MNERIKSIRDALTLSQEAFGKKIGLTRSGISNIESGLRSVSDRHVKLLMSAFGVSEKWLRTGDGEMFEQTDDTAFAALCRENNLSFSEQSMLRVFLSLPPASRAGVVDYYKALVADAVAQNETVFNASPSSAADDADPDFSIESRAYINAAVEQAHKKFEEDPTKKEGA